MNIFSMLGDGGTEPTPSWIEQYWIFIVLAVVLVALYVVSYVRRRKQTQQVADTLNGLKVGDKVKTYSGFYGTIVSIKETTDGKVALLETGEGKTKSFLEIDMNAIFGVDAKAPVVYDASGNVVDTTPVIEEAEATPVEETDSKSETELMLEKEKKASAKSAGKKSNK